MKPSVFAAAAVALFGMLGSAQAATLSGNFSVLAINAQNLNFAQSGATETNIDDAYVQAFFGAPGYAYDIFTYAGDLDFSTNNGNATTIASWLATGVNGSVSDLDLSFGDLQLSKSDVYSGTATTTFFVFTANFLLGESDFTVTHDDGIAIIDDGDFIGGFEGPNTVRTTFVPGFGGGRVGVLYVATNNDPSILNVDVAPVPLPAALPLLVAGLAGLGALRLRRKAA